MSKQSKKLAVYQTMIIVYTLEPLEVSDDDWEYFIDGATNDNPQVTDWRPSRKMAAIPDDIMESLLEQRGE